MKRFRRNAICYYTIDTGIDKDGNILNVGDYFIYNNNNNKIGPITQIMEESNLPLNHPIKYLVYINNNVYYYPFIQVYN